ncbi:uncharacterized protein LOC124657566 [Lolium rigidum]|uniref:uncharacterized protein LOC124657566 n=1 Tax=Lolium rigidum TaxID=89674 RepID=UPI001F5D930D|nr:uncharacterized protein LOC124657566 [Lolium rigidum]
MASYDYVPPSPSPPPPDGRTYHQKQARMSDLLHQLRRRANDGPTDRHREQQQQVQVINSDHLQLISPEADGTTRRTLVVICKKPRRPETPYQRPEHHERWSNPLHRRSPAPQEDDDDEGATKVVCLTKMLSPGDRLQDNGFYWDFQEDVTEEARKFGHLVKVVIPRPSREAAPVVAGVGKVFLEYMHLDDAAWCRGRLDGMCYNGKEITAEFFPQAKFAAGDYVHSKRRRKISGNSRMVPKP